MKKLLIITLLVFCIIGYAYGGENTTTYDDAPIILNDEPNKTVTALEDGHLNTSFSNNHKGYCVEYTGQEAHKGDQFLPVHTSHIRNNRTAEVSHHEKSKHLNTIKDITVQTEKTGIPTGLLILAIISIPILTYRKQ